MAYVSRHLSCVTYVASAGSSIQGDLLSTTTFNVFMFEWIKLLMPATAAVPHAQASNEQFKPTTRPVALFFGGTSGIGQAMAEQLANQTAGRAQIVILGRNQDAANKIIASFPRTPDGTSSEQESKYSFVKVDATSMAQVREVTSKLSKELDKINFIVLSTGFVTTKGRDETSEGIDRKLACNFYARFRFVSDLVPLVAKAEEKGERTGVMSVLAAGRGGAVDLNDLGLVKTFSLGRAEGQGVTYTDATFEVGSARTRTGVDLTSIHTGVCYTLSKSAVYAYIPRWRPHANDDWRHWFSVLPSTHSPDIGHA